MTTITGCPQCGDAGRHVVDGEPCHSCGAAWHPAPPLELGAANFAAHTGADIAPIIVHYHADWCAPCRALQPVFELAATHRRRLRFATCDVDAEPALAAAQAVANLPTVVLYADGKELARISGTMRLSVMLDWIDYQIDGATAGHP